MKDTPGVIAPPPLIYATGLAIGIGLDAVLPSIRIARAVSLPVGGIVIIAGLWLAVSFARAFRAARTPMEPWKPTTAIVTTGPYRLTRNPAYLAMAFIYVGIAIITSTVWPFATLVPVLLLMHHGVIRREERYLETKFGDEYVRFKMRTRRWL